MICVTYTLPEAYFRFVRNLGLKGRKLPFGLASLQPMVGSFKRTCFGFDQGDTI